MMDEKLEKYIKDTIIVSDIMIISMQVIDRRQTRPMLHIAYQHLGTQVLTDYYIYTNALPKDIETYILSGDYYIYIQKDILQKDIFNLINSKTGEKIGNGFKLIKEFGDNTLVYSYKTNEIYLFDNIIYEPDYTSDNIKIIDKL